MIGKCTHVVDCRETMGMGEGGGIAQRGTFAECGNEVLAVAMSPGRRHITKPVCEITFALREANILTSTLVLNAGAGVPQDAPDVYKRQLLQCLNHVLHIFDFSEIECYLPRINSVFHYPNQFQE